MAFDLRGERTFSRAPKRRTERGETDEAEITVSAVEPNTLLAFLKRVLHAINVVLTLFSD